MEMRKNENFSSQDVKPYLKQTVQGNNLFLNLALYYCYIKKLILEVKLEDILLDHKNNVKLTNVQNGTVSSSNFNFKSIGKLLYTMVTGREFLENEYYDYTKIPKGFCKFGYDLFKNLMSEELNSFHSILNHLFFTLE